MAYGPALNAAAIVLTAHANVPPEKAAQVIGMLLGVPVSAGWVDKAASRLARQLAGAGFEDAPAATPTTAATARYRRQHQHSPFPYSTCT